MCQIYVDDIIAGSTNQKSCEEFSRVMMQKFEMSMMGELTYFLGFQVKQLKDSTFISQTKYTQDLLPCCAWSPWRRGRRRSCRSEWDKYGVEKGTGNTVNFDPVKTKAVKLEIVQPADNSSGLFEWEVK